MKKRISLFLVVMMVLMITIIPKMPVMASVFTAGLSSSNVNIGDDVTVTITIPDGCSAIMTVSYNTSVISYTGDSVTSSGGDGAKVLSIYNTTGKNVPISASISFKAV